MELRQSESSTKAKGQSKVWLSAMEPPQPDSVLRAELTEVTALQVATRQLLMEWLK